MLAKVNNSRKNLTPDFGKNVAFLFVEPKLETNSEGLLAGIGKESYAHTMGPRKLRNNDAQNSKTIDGEVGQVVMRVVCAHQE